MIGFDLDNEDIRLSTTTTPPGDGLSNFWNQDDGDPIAHFPMPTYGGQPSEVNVVDVTPDENGTTYVGPLFSLQCGSYGCGTGVRFRGQSASAGKSQTFWDLTYMAGNYTSIGAIGDAISFWINIGGSEAVVRLSPSIVPTTTETCVDDSTVVNIAINEVTNLYGYQFQVNYTAALVSAANPGAFDISWFDTNGNGLVPPAWDRVCVGGICQFAKTEQDPGGSVNGSGTVAQVTLSSLGLPGNFILTITADKLADKDANPMPHTVASLPLTVCGLASVSGKVTLQGRAQPQGTAPGDPPGSVTLTDGVLGPFTAPINGLTGAFSFANIPVMPGGTNYQMNAQHQLYLTNGKLFAPLPPGNTINQNTKLLGGDANNSGGVELGDLACVGGAFGNPATVCAGPGNSDINWDGQTDILDLVLVGGNYNLGTGIPGYPLPPLPW